MLRIQGDASGKGLFDHQRVVPEGRQGGILADRSDQRIQLIGAAVLLVTVERHTIIPSEVMFQQAGDISESLLVMVGLIAQFDFEVPDARLRNVLLEHLRIAVIESIAGGYVGECQWIGKADRMADVDAAKRFCRQPILGRHPGELWVDLLRLPAEQVATHQLGERLVGRPGDSIQHGPLGKTDGQRSQQGGQLLLGGQLLDGLLGIEPSRKERLRAAESLLKDMGRGVNKLPHIMKLIGIAFVWIFIEPARRKAVAAETLLLRPVAQLHASPKRGLRAFRQAGLTIAEGEPGA